MLSTLVQVVVISFALIGAGFVLWLICQFGGALREARRELKHQAEDTVVIDQPFTLTPGQMRARDMMNVMLTPAFDKSHIERQVADIYRKKELDNDQAESHI